MSMVCKTKNVIVQGIKNLLCENKAIKFAAPIDEDKRLAFSAKIGCHAQFAKITFYGACFPALHL
jgi:hypothetical protein